MTKTISSQSDRNIRYFLTIEGDQAQACTCKGFQYRHHCKHVSLFNVEVRKAERFAAIFAKLDCRANGQEATQRCYYEIGLGI